MFTTYPKTATTVQGKKYGETEGGSKYAKSSHLMKMTEGYMGTL